MRILNDSKIRRNYHSERSIFFQIDPHATHDVSKALKRAPQAVIEITTSYKISRPRSADNLSFTINPRGGMLDRRLSLSPNHWIHQSQLQQRSYLRGTSVLSTAVENQDTRSDFHFWAYFIPP